MHVTTMNVRHNIITAQAAKKIVTKMSILVLTTAVLWTTFIVPQIQLKQNDVIQTMIMNLAMRSVQK